MENKKEAKSYILKMSKYQFFKLLSEGKNPLTGKRLFTPDQNLTNAMNSFGLFVLRYDNIDSDSFRVYNSNEQIEKLSKQIIEGKRARQNVEGRTGAVWTEDEDQQLVKEYLSNMSVEEIAKKHDRTISGVERRILKLVPIKNIKK